MTACFHLNEQTFSPSQILSLIVSYRLLPQLASELIIDQAIASITCTLEEKERACRHFYEQNQLLTEAQRHVWLQHYGMTPEQLESIPIRALRIEKFKQATWGHRLEAHFLAHKAQYDQVIYSQICLKDSIAAQEIYFRIQDGEQSFAELAQLYSQSAEAGNGGRIGPVPLSKTHLTLAQKLSISKPGQLWPPMQLGEWTVIVQLEQFISAQLDEPMRQILLNHLFETWTQEQVYQHAYSVQQAPTKIEPPVIESEITAEIKTYQQKVQNYKEAFVQATQNKCQPNEISRQKLKQTWQTLGLVEADVQSIEAPIYAQIEKHQANLRQYEREFTDATQQLYPLREGEHLSLQQRQQQLNLNDEDVAPIQTRITAGLEEHLQKLEQYRQVLSESIQFEYPLSKPTREKIQRFQQVLELSDKDAERIEAQILESQKRKTPVDEPVVEPPLEDPVVIAKPRLVKTKVLVGAGIAILGLSGISVLVMNLQTYRPEKEVPQIISAGKTTPVPTLRSPLQQAEVKPNNAKAAKEIAQLKRHPGSVGSVVFSPDSQTLVTSGEDGMIRLWNTQGQPLSQFKGHENAIRSVSFSPDGQQLVSDAGGKIRLWNLQGKLLREFVGSQKPIKSVKFSPDGKRLASAGDDGSIRLWNLQGQSLIEKEWKADLKRVLELAFSPDGQQLASGGDDGTVKVWNLQGKPLHKFTGHMSPILSVAFSPDGKQLVSGCLLGMIRSSNLSDYRMLKMYQVKQQAEVNSVAVSPDSRLVLSGDNQGNINLWKLNTQQQLSLWAAHQNSIINKVAFSIDGKVFATAADNGIVKLWHLQ